MDTIGIVCRPDHPVFGQVATRLASRGFDVHCFQPGEPIGHDELDALGGLVNTVPTRRSFAALLYADRAGIETWNGYTPTTALSCRLIALDALGSLGCPVPDIDFTRTDGDAIARSRYRWDAGTVASDVFYQKRIPTDPVTYRYYAVNDGVDTHVNALTVRSTATDQKSMLDAATVDVAMATRVRELLDRFDARAVCVDFVRESDGYVAVDVDPTPSFYAIGMERRIADSVASLTTIGA